MTTPKEPGKKRRRVDFSRLDWRRKKIGRITRPSGAKNARELHHRHQILTQLYHNGQLDVLAALRDGIVDMPELVQADREQKLGSADLLAHVKLRAPLWETFTTRVLPQMGKSEKTRQHYADVVAGVRRRGILGADATFADLLDVPWKTHRARYASAAAWNHVRRTFSAALTVLLGDKWHPKRRAFVAAFGTLDKEVAREVAITPAQLKRLLAQVPELTRPAVSTLLVTGVRVGELCNDEKPPRFDPETGLLRVWGKTDERTVVVPPAFRGIVTAALPVRVAKRTLQGHVLKATRAAKLGGFRTHDLRHAAAGLALDGGAPINAVQDALGHADLATTAKYLRAGNKQRAGEAVERALDLTGTGPSAAPSTDSSATEPDTSSRDGEG